MNTKRVSKTDLNNFNENFDKKRKVKQGTKTKKSIKEGH
jgi:hypothetical protein